LLILHDHSPDARDGFLGDGIDPLGFTEKAGEAFGDFSSDEIVRKPFVGDDEAVFGCVAVHPVEHELLIFVNLNVQIMIPPLDPFIHRRPLRMHWQMISHLENMIEKTRNALQRIPHHHKRPLDVVVEIDQDAIALRVMRLDRDDVPAAAVVVPIVARPETGEGLHEIPGHAGAASGVGGRVGDGRAGGGFFGPCDLAASIGEGDGEAAVGGRGDQVVVSRGVVVGRDGGNFDGWVQGERGQGHGVHDVLVRSAVQRGVPVDCDGATYCQYGQEGSS